MSDRGSYRPIYEAILHDPRFLALSPNARLTFYTLKVGLGPSGIDVVYQGALEVQTGLGEEVLGEVLGELLEGEWIAYEELARGVLLVWIREGLDNEPNMNLENEPKRKGVENHLNGLPKCATVNEFCDRYGFPQRTSSRTSSRTSPGTSSMTSSRKENGERREENGEREKRPDALEHTPREEPDVDGVDNSSGNGKGERRGVPPEVLENPWHREHDDRGTKVIEALEHLVRGKKLEEYALQVARARPGPWRDRIYEVASDILADARSGEIDYTLCRASMVKAINGK